MEVKLRLEKFQITDDGFGYKTLSLIVVNADFEVIDEFNNSLSHFKYCEFQRLMKGRKKLYDIGIHEGVEVGKVNGIYVSNNPGQKVFRESYNGKSKILLPQMKMRISSRFGNF